MIAEDEYRKAFSDPAQSDVYEHLPTLRFYAGSVDDVAEVGVHDGTTSWAFLLGRPRRLYGYDIARHPKVDLVQQAAAEIGVEYAFHEGDSLTAVMPPVDLLFLDTLHAYDQVLGELRRFAKMTRKYVIGHDSVSFGWADQPGPGGKGICPAIGAFLREDPDWRLTWDKSNCNGLYLLTRVGTANLWTPPFGG